MTRTETQSRKRPAPGTSPPPHNTSSYSGQDMANPSQLSNEDFLALGNGYGSQNQQLTSGIYDLDNFDGFGDPQPNQGASATGQLVRRNQEQSVAPGGRDQQQHQSQSGSSWSESNDYTELEQRAMEARKIAQSQKPQKQVQPFIQKLWSLLQDNTNTDLIRWTADGDSFVVLDEERFASEQLPTYFKHDNYPSFVRQLNMYGFHKRVGLTDNSMRASKTKAKSPSEYENPFFKRDRPILQWLITKPKQQPSRAKTKKPKDDEEDSDDHEPQVPATTRRDEPQPRKSLDMVPVPKTQLAQFQDEISKLKRSQQHINSMIARFQHENNQYIRRASAQHERHEQSINAILQFLATFYNQSKEGANLSSMFHGAIHQQHQPQGNVQEMNDVDDSTADTTNNQIARVRRPPLLLQAPPLEQQASPSPAASSRPASHQQQLRDQSSTPAQPQTSQSPAIKRNSDSPPNTGAGIGAQTEARPANASTPSNNDMLAVINNMNANTPGGAPDIDLNLALRNYENINNGPLSPEQRDSMLSLLASTSGLSPSTSNALLSSGGGLGSPSAGALSQWAANREHIDMLQRLQQEQDSKVADLAGRIQPLSPNGSIPGFDQAYNHGTDINYDNYLNSELFNGDGSGGGDDYFGAAGAGVDFDGFGGADNVDPDMFHDEDFDQDMGQRPPGFSNDGTGGNADTSAGANSTANANANAGLSAGRVIGSVPTSEGARTPNARATGASDEVDGAADDGDAGEGRSRKRRRV